MTLDAMPSLQTTRAPAIPSRRLMTRQRRRAVAFYTFISPWLIGFVLLSVIPLLFGLAISFTNYDGLNLDNLKWVGWRNYERILTDSTALNAIQRSITWTVMYTPLWLLCSFGLALIINQARRFKGIIRTLFYLPSILPIVAVVWAWKPIMAANYGLLNAILRLFAPGATIPWLQGDGSLFSLTIVAVWMGIGTGMLIFLAGLQSISTELVDAARIDGANRWHVTWSVIVPLMTPVIFFQFLQGMIGSFQQFVLPMLFTGAALGSRPPQSSYLYMVHVNQQMFTAQRFSYGIAMIWAMFVVIILVALLLFWSSRFWVFYDNEDYQKQEDRR